MSLEIPTLSSEASAIVIAEPKDTLVSSLAARKALNCSGRACVQGLDFSSTGLVGLVQNEVDQVQQWMNEADRVRKIELLRKLTVQGSRNFAQYERLKKTNFLSRIPPHEWEALLKRIGDLDYSRLSIDVIDAFENGKWQHEIFQSDEWIVFAMSAYLNGILDEKFMPKLILYHACKKESALEKPPAEFQLFNKDGTINPKGQDAFRAVLGPYFEDMVIDAIIEEFRNKPHAESQFFQVHHTESLSTGSFRVLIAEKTNFGISVDMPDQIVVQTVFPPEFLAVVYSVAFGASAAIPVSFLGYKEKERLSIVGQRPVSLGIYNFISLPKILHEREASYLFWYYHDVCYHAFLDSINMHRQAWIDIAFALKTEKFFSVMSTIFDGAFVVYTNFLSQRGSWKRSRIEQLQQSGTDFLFFSGIEELTTMHFSKEADKIISVFLTWIRDNGKKYGLTLDRFKQFLQKPRSDQKLLNALNAFLAELA